MESNLRIRKSNRLSRGRVSLPGNLYFLTLCTCHRNCTLTEGVNATEIFRQIEVQATNGDFDVRCGVVMPDHLHLVIELGKQLSLGQVVAKFKSKTRSFVEWQRGFYDRRIREDENEEAYARYLFLNPYRKGLLGLESRWDFWKRWREVPYEFEELLYRDGKKVPSGWLIEVDATKTDNFDLDDAAWRERPPYGK